MLPVKPRRGSIVLRSNSPLLLGIVTGPVAAETLDSHRPGPRPLGALSPRRRPASLALAPETAAAARFSPARSGPFPYNRHETDGSAAIGTIAPTMAASTTNGKAGPANAWALSPQEVRPCANPRWRIAKSAFRSLIHLMEGFGFSRRASAKGAFASSISPLSTGHRPD
jgi:hypothetical protein